MSINETSNQEFIKAKDVFMSSCIVTDQAKGDGLYF